MSQQPPIRLSADDLYSEKVEAFLEERALLQRNVPDLPTPPLFQRILLAPWFYLALAGAFGAFVAWLVTEPFINDSEIADPDKFDLVGFLLFAIVAAFVGFFLGAVEGLMSRNLQRALLSALIGLGVGFIGGLLATFLAEIVYAIMSLFVVAIAGQQNFLQGNITGFAFLVQMMARGTAWAIVGIPAGIGQGIAVQQKKVIINGLLGGVLGGLLGGMLFDPIYFAFTERGDEADVSRGIGFVVIGLLVGLFIGLVEQWTKSAWLLMKAGPLAGKQFVIYRNPTVLGSSPKADVYLFKDDAIEPRHALIHNRGGRYEIEDCETPDGTYVNGIPVKKQYLQNGDQIVLGKTVFEFSLRETGA